MVLKRSLLKPHMSLSTSSKEQKSRSAGTCVQIMIPAKASVNDCCSEKASMKSVAPVSLRPYLRDLVHGSPNLPQQRLLVGLGARAVADRVHRDHGRGRLGASKLQVLAACHVHSDVLIGLAEHIADRVVGGVRDRLDPRLVQLDVHPDVNKGHVCLLACGWWLCLCCACVHGKG